MVVIAHGAFGYTEKKDEHGFFLIRVHPCVSV